MIERADPLNIFEIAKQKIPIGECQIIADDLGVGNLYIAPEGKIFVMRGKFEKWADFSDVYFMDPPQPSYDSFIDENKVKIEKIMKDKNLDIDSAINELLSWDNGIFHDGENPVKEFIGKKLKILVEYPKEKEPSFRISILGNVFAELHDTIHPIHSTLDEGFFSAPNYFFKENTLVSWRRIKATGYLGQCNVELIEYLEPEPKLWLPTTST